MKSLLRSPLRWYLGAFQSQMAFSERFTLTMGALLLLVNVGLSASCPQFYGQRFYNFFLFSLICIAGGLTGWLIGIFLSPLGSQHNGVRQIATAVSAFWSGVIVANLDSIRRVFLHESGWLSTTPGKLRLLVGLTTLILGLAGTFNSRFDDSQIGAAQTGPQDLPAGSPRRSSDTDRI